jgi:hypothetical protein
MKNTILTFALIFISVSVFGQTATQILAKNNNTVKGETLAAVNLAISIDTESANWFTVMLSEYQNFAHISESSEIAGVSITVKKSASASATVYDDIVRLFVPASMNFDGATSQSEINDIVSNNLSSTQPWSNGVSNINYGGTHNNWGLEGVKLADILKYGLGFEFKADGDLENAGVSEIEATIYFSGSTQNTVKLTGSINQGRFR